MTQGLERVLVVGSSGCGKTTFARGLARILGIPYIELDALYWGPNWTARRDAEFWALTESAIAGPKWVVDGNYTRLRRLLWPRATSVVWLNYGFVTVFLRVLCRTVRRIVFREELFSGNRESFAEAFLSKKSILWWVITTYAGQRKKYESLRQSGEFPHLRWHEFGASRDAEGFIAELEKAA